MSDRAIPSQAAAAVGALVSATAMPEAVALEWLVMLELNGYTIVPIPSGHSLDTYPPDSA